MVSLVTRVSSQSHLVCQNEESNPNFYKIAPRLQPGWILGRRVVSQKSCPILLS